MFRKLLVGVLSATVFVSAKAEVSAVNAYRQEAANGYLDCRTTAVLEGSKNRAFLMTGKLPMGDDGLIYDCAEKRSQTARDLLTPAVAALKRDEATRALKLYHVAYSAALKGLVQGSSESDSQYASRQENQRSKMEEAWSLFELEQ